MDDDDGPRYEPIDRADTLAVCTECGVVVEGDATGQTRHDIWHRHMVRTAAVARRARGLGVVR